jgi:hypothetical protein
MIDSNFHRRDHFPFLGGNRGREQHRRSQFRLIILGTIALLAILAFSITFALLVLGKEHPPATGPEFDNLISMTFTPSTSYSQALDAVTNLGFQPGLLCSMNVRLTSEQTNVRLWQPMGQQDTFLHDHHLSIIQSSYTPPDWLHRLQTIPGVLAVKPIRFPFPPCSPSLIASGIPAPGVAIPLSGAEPIEYARITFTSPLNTYNTALYMVSNLGLLLSDPCYKEAVVQTENRTIQYPWDSQPSWHPMRQESKFKTSHTLLLETVPLITSSLWQSQLRALSGIENLTTISTTSCT